MSIPGDERPIYQGLPPFISDSLPDSWGNRLFDRWTKENKMVFATDNDIPNARSIIDDVAKSLTMFDEYAEQNHIRQPWRSIIQKTISHNLTTFGYLETDTLYFLKNLV